MSEFENDKSSASTHNHAPTSEDLNELRCLLLGVEPPKLDKLYKRLDDPNISAEDVSRVLPEAVILQSLQDKQLGEAIAPTVEEAIQTSVKKDLNVLANAIFPIIGPATRKAIATALEEMTQSLNQTLEHSLSPQSFKWRLEARRTGKSFAEVVLLRTLIYRVEQIFLIHKHTGLVLQHLVAPLVTAQDADLVSAMLTAIQDFVKDSFNVKGDEGLETLHFGELTIWVEVGPQAVLAGIIRGNAPQELRLLFQETIEKIHLKFSRQLQSFQGDASVFDPGKPYLEACLQSRYQVPEQKNNTYALLALGTVAIALGIGGFFYIRDRLRWSNYINQLQTQPGIVVIKAEQSWGKNYISGLRDPLAIDPNQLITQHEINPRSIVSHWEPYLSLNPDFAVKRVVKLLQPPKTVTLTIDNNGILSATGTAPQQWIVEARRLTRFLPEITQYQDQNLVSTDQVALDNYRKQLERQMIFFVQGNTDLMPGQNDALNRVATTVKKLVNTAKNLGKNVNIQIIGHANTDGTEQFNQALSQARATTILTYLAAQGINTSNFTVVGVGSRQPLNPKLTAADPQLNRRVAFKVLFSDAPNKRNLQ